MRFVAHGKGVKRTGSQPPDDSGSSDGGVDDRDDAFELGLEDGVEVGR
jgi:hypothetical protein